MTGVFVLWSDRSNSPGWIEDGSGCHIWFGSLAKTGYGTAWDGQRSGLVHRIRYEREIGPVPEGLVLDHVVCDNKKCCNPRHLRPVTAWENTRRGDSFTAKHARKTHCKHGHPLSGDNLYRYRDARICRTCMSRWHRKTYLAHDKARRAERKRLREE